MKDALLYKAPTLHHLMTYSIPQSDRWPLVPMPSTGSASENLFETGKDWPVSPTPAPTIKTEAPLQVAVIPHAMVIPNQVEEKCTWGPHCPICKNEEENREED